MSLNLINRNLSSWEEVYAEIDQRGCTIHGEHGKRELINLSVDNNRISGWCHFTPGSLIYLNLNKNRISDWERFTPGSLQYLYLGNNRISDWEHFTPGSLKTLYLHNNRISDWLHFTPGSLTRLDLYNNRISDWKHFTQGSLTTLWISNNPLDNGSVKFKHIKVTYPIKLYLIRKRALRNYIARSRVSKLSSLLQFNRDSELFGDFFILFSR